MRVRTVAELLLDGRQSVDCAALRGRSGCAGGGWAWPQVGGAGGEGAWPDDNPTAWLKWELALSSVNREIPARPRRTAAD